MRRQEILVDQAIDRIQYAMGELSNIPGLRGYSSLGFALQYLKQAKEEVVLSQIIDDENNRKDDHQNFIWRS